MKKNAITVSRHDMRKVLSSMLGRVTELNISGRVSHDSFRTMDNEDFSELLKDQIAGLDEPKEDAAKEAWKAQRKTLCGLIDRSRQGQSEAITELNELRIFAVDLFVRATSNFTQFFQTVNLGATDQPYIQTTYGIETPFRYIGEDGGVKRQTASKAQKNVAVLMKELTSVDVTYPLRDINTGVDVSAASQATVDIAYDLQNKVDVDAKALLDSLFSAFVTTGPRLNRTFVPSSRVDNANLPTSNTIDLTVAPWSDYDAPTPNTTKFRLAAIRAIVNYCSRWSTMFGTQPLRPTGVIFVPSADVEDIAIEILPTSNVNNGVADAVLANYTSFTYLGVRWTLVPDVTLAPGYAYPVLNRPVGWIWYKPSMDMSGVDTNMRKNEESRYQTKVLAMASPEGYRPFALRVKYDSGVA